MQQQLMLSVSNMLIALLTTMARIDNDKRIERSKQDINWMETTREADHRELHEMIVE